MKNKKENLFDGDDNENMSLKDKLSMLANDDFNDKKYLLILFMNYWNDTDHPLITEAVVLEFLHGKFPLNNDINGYIKA